jgi:ribonuclease Z
VTPLLHPTLVNGRFGDPAVCLDIKFERRAVLFDLGDLHALPARKMLRLTDAFVSHAHVDHFIGFDQILRTLLGREATLRLFGPAGFIEHVGHRLASYTWNLVDRYASDLVFAVTEIADGAKARRAVFRLANRFMREDQPPAAIEGGVILAEPAFRVRAAVLDHGIPSLAYAFEESAHVNVHKDRLVAHGAAPGPWLRDVKHLLLAGAGDDTAVEAAWPGGARRFRLGEIRDAFAVAPGQKIGYVVDLRYTEANAARVAALTRGADILIIESCFAAADAALAAKRRHLTTAQAGTLARRAGVRRVEPFHFSPRYAGEEARLLAEVHAAFAGLVNDEPLGHGGAPQIGKAAELGGNDGLGD